MDSPGCQADLNVGSRAQIVGLQRAVELNGVEVVVLEEEEGRGRLGYGKAMGKPMEMSIKYQ